MNFSIDKSDLEFAESKLADLVGSLKNKNFFIAGASGFFGRCLLEMLLFINEKNNLGIKIYAVSRSLENFKKKFPLLSETSIIEVIESDIATLKKSDYKIDYLIHAACDTSPEKLKNSPEKFCEENYLGTLKLLEIARGNKDCQFLYLSSGAVYGSQDSTVKLRQESDFNSPDLQNISSLYGETKRLCEMLCTIYNSAHGVKTKIARCFSFVGPYMNFDGHYAIGNFIRDVANDKDVILNSKTKTYRSYLYSVDLVIWLIKILVSAPSGSVYNVGSSRSILVADLADLVIKTLSSKSKIAFFGEKSFNTSSSSYYIPANEKAQKELGLQEYTSLENSIKKSSTWYQKNKTL